VSDTGPVPLSVVFKCLPTGGNGKYFFSWRFGDGQISSEQSPTHKYSAIGIYIASVTVTCDKESVTSSLNIKAFLEKTVNIAGGGGGAEITFSASSGQKIRITLKAGEKTMEPYGHLESPSGSAEYTPSNENIQNGENSSEVTLKASGKYILTVFDGSNQGGIVSVRIEQVGR